MTKILTKELILQSYSMAEIVDAVEVAYKQLAAGTISVPARIFVDTKDGGDILYGAAINKEAETFIVLSSPYMPWQAKEKQPVVKGFYLYQSYQTGELLAVVNGEDLVQLRTGAKSAVAAKYLARRNSQTLGLIGLGTQAKMHAEAMATQFQLNHIVGYSPHADSRQETFAYIKDKTRLSVEIMPITEVVKRADIIVVGTYAKDPLVRFGDLQPGQLIISLGHGEEVSSDVVTQANSYVDYKESATNGSAPVKAAIDKGWDFAKIRGDLSEVVAGQVKPRESDAEIVYFQSVGITHENLAAVEYFYKKLKSKAPSISFE